MTYDIFYLGKKPNEYINAHFADSVEDAREKSTTENFWIIDEFHEYENILSFKFDSNNDLDNINKQFINIWPNNLVKDSGVWLYPKKHSDIKVYRGDVKPLQSKKGYDCFLIDHHNNEFDQVRKTLELKFPENKIVTIKYWRSYLNTLRRIADSIPDNKDRYIWICSSVCDYSDFMFEKMSMALTQSDHIYTYPSLDQKFGDTFLLHTKFLKAQIHKVDKLENYKFINFRDQSVKRLPAPVICHNDDTHVFECKTKLQFPYVVYETKECVNKDIVDTPMNLWSEETQNIVVTNKGASRIIFPRIANFYINKQLYDYPRIFTNETLHETKSLDIIFLSNGEKCADEHYQRLLHVTKNCNNKIIRVDNINGRVNAYHATAKASSTDWYFTVFAKLSVSEDFDWAWQPDRLQSRKHYIFYALNPVNNLIYGHQAMIAYNKKLVLNNYGVGLDFTLDDEHQVVEINSGTAHFNTDAFTTWRTAFREVIKLKSDNTEISKKRLHAWLNIGNGMFGEHSILGAKDACNYFDEVDGNLNALKQSYDWPWLKSKFYSLYNK